MVIRPSHKKEAVLVRILERDETTAPTFIDRRLYVSPLCSQLVVKLIDIIDTNKEVNTASSSQHRFVLLSKRDPQFSAAKLCLRRFLLHVERLNFHPEHVMIESNRLFETIHFQKQQIQTTNHIGFQRVITK